MSGLPRWVANELYREVSNVRTCVEENFESPDLIRADNMLRWAYPLRALQGCLRCLSIQAYFSEAHYECPPSLNTVQVFGNIALIFHEMFSLLADQNYEKGLAKYLKAGALGISMYLDVDKIVPLISLADYLAAQHDPADAVPVHISALNHLKANPVSILNTEEKRIT